MELWRPLTTKSRLYALPDDTDHTMAGGNCCVVCPMLPHKYTGEFFWVSGDVLPQIYRASLTSIEARLYRQETTFSLQDCSVDFRQNRQQMNVGSDSRNYNFSQTYFLLDLNVPSNPNKVFVSVVLDSLKVSRYNVNYPKITCILLIESRSSYF